MSVLDPRAVVVPDHLGDLDLDDLLTPVYCPYAVSVRGESAVTRRLATQLRLEEIRGQR